MTDYVILVDEHNNEIGKEEKMSAHEKGLLHRAFSIIIYNHKKQMLLQRRASTKYHSPLLWSNACCSHPRPGETLESATRRRLQEELGIECRLENPFSFIYKSDVGQGLIEHEFDFVFIGYTDSEIKPNPEEIEECAWIEESQIILDAKTNPEKYTPWFRILLAQLSTRK